MTVGPETCYRVQGGIPLQGTVFVQGAKNAALKMIAAGYQFVTLASESRMMAAKAAEEVAAVRKSGVTAGRLPAY